VLLDGEALCVLDGVAEPLSLPLTDALMLSVEDTDVLLVWLVDRLPEELALTLDVVDAEMLELTVGEALALGDAVLDDVGEADEDRLALSDGLLDAVADNEVESVDVSDALVEGDMVVDALPVTVAVELPLVEPDAEVLRDTLPDAVLVELVLVLRVCDTLGLRLTEVESDGDVLPDQDGLAVMLREALKDAEALVLAESVAEVDVVAV
jgi:hypothetical protein